MKMKIRSGEQTFAVEVGDLQARPIVAMVEGERFEVWPEEEVGPTAVLAKPGTIAQPAQQPPASAATATTIGRNHVQRAPIPGVVRTVSVRPGMTVAPGQELCVLEAMKMNNIIRATQAGTVAAIHISAGQHVKHNDVLVEYEG